MSTGDIIGVTWLVGSGVTALIVLSIGVSLATRAKLNNQQDKFEDYLVGTVLGLALSFLWPLAIPIALVAAPQATLIKREQRRVERAEQQRKALRDSALLFPAGSEERRLLIQAAEGEL